MKKPRPGAYGGTRTGAGSPWGRGGPHEAFIMKDTVVRALWFSWALLQVQLLARVDEVGVGDDVLVQLEHLLPAALDLVLLGDRAEGVALDDLVLAVTLLDLLAGRGGDGLLGRRTVGRTGGALLLGRTAARVRGAVGRLRASTASVEGAGQTRAADRPGTLALRGEDLLGDGDLLGLSGLVGLRGVLRAAVSGPGGGRELQTAVVAVAGVDGPVAAGLALGDGVPLGGGGGGGVAGRHQRGGDGDTGDTGERGGAGGLGRTTVLALAGKQHGGSPHRRLRGELSGSGRLSCPVAHPAVRGFTPSRSSVNCWARRLPWVPRSCLRRLTRRLFPFRRWQDSALRQTGLGLPSGHDRRHALGGISKTIRASETHPTLSPKWTFGAKCDVNSRCFSGLFDPIQPLCRASDRRRCCSGRPRCGPCSRRRGRAIRRRGQGSRRWRRGSHPPGRCRSGRRDGRPRRRPCSSSHSSRRCRHGACRNRGRRRPRGPKNCPPATTCPLHPLLGSPRASCRKAAAPLPWPSPRNPRSS